MQSVTSITNIRSRDSGLSSWIWDLLCRMIAAAFFVYLGVENALKLGTLVSSDGPTDRLHLWASICAKSLIIVFIGLNCVLFLVRLKPVRKANGLVPRITALAGSFFFYLLAIPQGEPAFWQAVMGSLFLCAGTFFAIYSLSSLGRSFSMMAEARKLITTGPYSIVRHPLYLGEQIAIAGIVIQNLSLYAIALFTIHLWIQIQRMKHEEAILQNTFPEYATQMSRRARLIPLLY